MPERRLFARNPPPVEGELQRLDQRSLMQVLPEGVRRNLTVREGESTGPGAAGKGYGEVWRMLALVLLAVMALESVLAWRFGRR